jgi:hypothetical protein
MSFLVPEPQIVPSASPEQAEPSSTFLSSTEPSQIRPDQPSSPPANANGFNFASNLSQHRSPRARDYQIIFHAPLESPSPSRATQRSLSASISTPPPDLSRLRMASIAPELVISGSSQGQPPVTTKLELQGLEAAELPEQTQSQSLADSQSVQATTQPETALEPTGSGSMMSSVKIGGLHHSYDVFQPGVEDSNRVKPSGESGDSQPLAIESLNLNTSSTEMQAGTQNGFDGQWSHPFPQHENGDQQNGYAHSNRNSIHSTSSGYWLLPSDPEENAVPTVSEQLTRLSATREFADWSIEVSGPFPHPEPIGYLAHGMIMARSPTLRQEMRRKMHSHRMERIVVISPDWPIQPQGFEAVLRYLYTENLLTKQEVEQMFRIGGPENGMLTGGYQHHVVLSYWMAGLILGLPLVTHRAVQLVQETMDWGILELAFQQALILEERALNPTANLLTTQPNTPGSSRAGTASAASAQNILRSPFSPSPDYFVPTANLDATSDYRYPTINAMMSKKIKEIVFEFISQHVEISSFEADDPSDTILKSYLPETREYSNSSRYKSNPALAAIRFGNMPLAEEEMPPARAPSAISRSAAQVTFAILLNLKFTDLYDFCLVLKNTTGEQAADGSLCDWVQRIIAEREKRRRKVLNSKTVSSQERLSKEQAWHVVGCEEYVEATDDSFALWEIRQKFTGFTLPARQ